MKYDDLDWHEGSAEEAGQPREQAFTHVGLFLTWPMRHDLHAPPLAAGDPLRHLA